MMFVKQIDTYGISLVVKYDNTDIKALSACLFYLTKHVHTLLHSQLDSLKDAPRGVMANKADNLCSAGTRWYITTEK